MKRSVLGISQRLRSVSRFVSREAIATSHRTPEMMLIRRTVAADAAFEMTSKRYFDIADVRWPLLALAVGLASFVMLLVVIPDIFIPDTSLGWVDAWYYVGFARRLPEKLARYHTLYQSERIAWTLPAYVFNRVAPLLIANYLVKGVFFLTTTFFLFGSVREITGSLRAAAFVSALAAFHSFLVHSLGTSYVDGPMNTYVLGTIYFSTRAFLKTRRVGSAFLAGACVGCQLFTHLASLALLPSFAIYGLMTWTRAVARGRRLLLCIAALGWGIVSVLVGAMALYAHWGPNSLPLSQSVMFFFNSTNNSWIQPSNSAWLQHALWLLLPTAVMAWVVIAIVRSLSISWSAPLRLPAAFWLLFGVYFTWVALYFLNQPWLMLPYYSSCLIAPTFLALGPISARPVEALSANAYKRLLTALFVSSGLTYWLSGPRMVELAVIIALACVAAATSLRLRWRWHASEAFPMLLVGAAASINYATADFGMQLRNGYAQTRMNVIYRPSDPDRDTKIPRAARFKAAVAAADRLDFHLSGYAARPYFFWYDGDDDLGMFYRSMTSLLFAWSTSHLLGEDFHDFDHQNRHTLTEYTDGEMRDLVILTSRPHITLPDSRFTLQWTDREEVEGAEYFVHYLAFEPVPMTVGP
jgi:hypothetical protein